MINIVNVNKTFFNQKENKIYALKDINLNISKGDIFGIIGYSGAGKSTLLRCINGLEKPTSGKVIALGDDITTLTEKELRKKRKKIGMIFQYFNLLSSRTVAGNVSFPLKGKKIGKKEQDEIVEELLNLVGLADKAKVYPRELSGGQKQRVAIARALATEPQILLCDEATSSLDPITTKSILKLLKDIQKKLGLTIVLITHQMEVIKDICTKVAVMENGKIVEQGKVIDVFTNPQSNIAKKFVSKNYNYERLDNIQEGNVGKMLHIQYKGSSANQAIISDISKKFNVSANIICGNIEKLQDTLIGNLIIDLKGEDLDINAAINYLKIKNIKVEVIEDERIFN